ncbi:MAG: hypothetical protein U5R31_13440 [Acidimicrobiia bacterium]|nr:hypothetical protein [Acidimicrobiia bacterium]
MDRDEPQNVLDPDPDLEPTHRERLAALIEQRLDIPMAVLAVAWAALVLYELVAPADQRDELRIIGDVLWGVFLVEFVLKIAVSGRPFRYVYRHWLSVLFLALPALRAVRVFTALRTMRVLPAARVVGSSYRTLGTARTLLGGRLVFLGVTTVATIVAGGQLLFLLEAGGTGGADRLGDTIWWASNLAISGTYLFEPQTVPGRLVSLLLSGYAVVVFAGLAATLGAFFVEERAERATVEDGGAAAG